MAVFGGFRAVSRLFLGVFWPDPHLLEILGSHGYLRKNCSTYPPRLLLSRIIAIPRMTILAADLAADCLSATPLKAPSRIRRRIPSIVEAVIEKLGERRIKGSRSIRDENMEVAEIIVPERNALLLIRASIRRTWGWSIPRAGRVFPFRFRFVLSSASKSRPFFSVVSER